MGLFTAFLVACGSGSQEDAQPTTAEPSDAGGDAERDSSPACALTVCSGRCVDTKSDRDHCGACGSSCAAYASCVSSTCVCPKNKTVCGGVCVDERVDSSNCGACGVACSSGQVCSAGACHKPGDILFDVDGASNAAPAIDSNGRVYGVGTDGFVRRFDPSGTPSWTSKTSIGAGHTHYYAIGGVALDEANDHVYVGGTDGNVHAFDLSGSFLWKGFVGGDPSYQTPTIGSAKLGSPVIVGTHGNVLAAFSSSGTSKWTYTFAGTTYSSSPAMGADGTIYAASWSDGQVYAIDAAGKLQWSKSNGGGAVTSAAIGKDGTIYVGNHAPSDGIFRAFNPDGTEKWKYSVGNFHGGCALDAQDTVYIGNDNELVALRLDGTLKWRVSAGAGAQPWVCGNNSVGDDGNVYVPVCGNQTLTAFEPSAGKLQYAVPLLGYPGPTAIGDNGVLYVGTTAGRLYGIAVSAHGHEPASSWPKHHRDPANRGAE